jgi:hypothetical protein
MYCIHHAYKFFQVTSSSDTDDIVTASVTRYLVLTSAYDGNQNCRVGNVGDHKGIFFRRVGYSRYDAHSEMFYRDNNDDYEICG